MPTLVSMTTKTIGPDALGWTFGDRIRKIRNLPEVALTQAELADVLGIRRSTLATWEKRGAEPSMRDAVRIAERLEEQFGVPADWTLGRQPTVAYPPVLPPSQRRRASDHPFRPAA